MSSITENTIFILGAGASKPYGYPTGQELRHYICKQFPTDLSSLINDSSVINYTPDELDDLLDRASEFSESFYNSSTPSIDLFLARRQEFSDIGKMAIVTKILLCENKSRFREDVFEPDDWYTYLYRQLT